MILFWCKFSLFFSIFFLLHDFLKRKNGTRTLKSLIPYCKKYSYRLVPENKAFAEAINDNRL